MPITPENMKERLEKIIDGLYASLPLAGSIALAAKYPAGNFTGKYLIETAYPFAMYFSTKLLVRCYGRSFKNKERAVAAFMLSLCYAFEVVETFCQAYAKANMKSEPGDFVAYTAGICLALAADKLTFNKKI